MSTALAIPVTAAGVLLIVLGLRDVFDALFHPEGRGNAARAVERAVWRLLRRLGRRERVLPLAGPLALLAVIGTWASMLILGWALVFWPHVPDGFHFAPELDRGHDFVDALNVSLVSLTTVGFGDVAPEATLLRLIVPLEALVGFGLLSASISYLLLIYPVLARRRSLAYEIALLRQTEPDPRAVFDRLEPRALERVLNELTSRLIAVERDFVNFPISYYFTEADPRFALPASAPYLLELAETGARDVDDQSVRLRATMLREAMDDLAATTAGFHGGPRGAPAEALRAYARHHRVD